MSDGVHFRSSLLHRSEDPQLAASTSPHSTFTRIQRSTVIDPRDGASVSPLPSTPGKKTLCILTPQLGEFDSAELAELLAEVQDDLQRSNIELKS